MPEPTDAEWVSKVLAILDGQPPTESAVEPPSGCVCGHARFMHHRQHGQCMASTPSETWACDCSEWRPEVIVDGR